ncbi:DegV family protein [Bacillus gobiensis]|uniref:DegV family protein n=1 Tax=Bacillus gobiensis TaxID=1441095 RepID=UPI0009E6A0AD|nr:DegV family protein [Bacillus gobiensis]
MKIAVLTDSTAYIPEDIMKKHNIYMIPLNVVIEGRSYKEEVDLSWPDYYEKVKELKELPTTSQPSFGEFLTMYEKLAESYDAVISVHLSSGISGTFSSSVSAGEMAENIKVYPFDSEISCMIQGFYAIEASELAEQGMEPEEILQHLEALKKRTRAYFMVDDLAHLQRGGRLSGAQAFIGGLLQIKPVLHFVDKLIVPFEKIRTRKKALNRIYDLFAEDAGTIRNGKLVCIATPRTDVVLELAPRLKDAFSGFEIAALYGGSKDRGTRKPLTISTTHQLLRYKNAFDVIIIDEVDAFPYSADKKLQFAVKKARKHVSACIYLSATPSKEMKRDVEKGQLHAVRIPARFHRRPLPEPSWKWIGNWEKKLSKNKLPLVLTNWVKNHCEKNNPIFLFVPTIPNLTQTVKLLKRIGYFTEGVHAEDKMRKEKVQQFRDQQLQILVTTTILERGVTVKNAQVGVLGAESAIFTESALVQIAGRAGRHPEFAKGHVVFFHYGKTKAMLEARAHIKEMNQIALRDQQINRC